MMNELLIWMLICYGATNIIVFGKIFEPFREFFRTYSNGVNGINKISGFIYEMITCPMCFSVWFGFFMGIFIYSPVNHIFGLSNFVSWFFDGILSSGIVWIINTIVEFFEESRIGNNNKE